MLQQAAVLVLDHEPDGDEVGEFAHEHLADFPADEATATCEIVYSAPDWLSISEQDQLNAFMRDGSACILVVYMQEENGEEVYDE